jgi:hypothetical protein
MAAAEKGRELGARHSRELGDALPGDDRDLFPFFKAYIEGVGTDERTKRLRLLAGERDR